VYTRAFLFFSQDRRGAIKAKNPGIGNPEISRILGETWRKTAEEEKQPYRDHEAIARGKYKTRIYQWREEQAKKEEEAGRWQEEETQVLRERGQQQQEPPQTAQGARHIDFWTSALDDKSHSKAPPAPSNYNTGTPTCESDDLNVYFLSRTVTAALFPSPFLTQAVGSNIQTDHDQDDAKEMPNHLGPRTYPSSPAQSHIYDVSYHHQVPPHQTRYSRNGNNEQAHDRGYGHSSHENHLSSSYLPSISYQQSEPYAQGAELPDTPRAHGSDFYEAHSYRQWRTGHSYEQSAYAFSEADDGAAWSQQYVDFHGHLMHQPATESHQHNVFHQVTGSLSSYDKAPTQNCHPRDSVIPATGNELRPYSQQDRNTCPDTTIRSHESSGSQYPPDYFSSSGFSHLAYSEQSRNRRYSTQPCRGYIPK
jgi:hypothetical protein